jgi:hypothetical protein
MQTIDLILMACLSIEIDLDRLSHSKNFCFFPDKQKPWSTMWKYLHIEPRHNQETAVHITTTSACADNIPALMWRCRSIGSIGLTVFWHSNCKLTPAVRRSTRARGARTIEMECFEFCLAQLQKTFIVFGVEGRTDARTPWS